MVTKNYVTGMKKIYFHQLWNQDVKANNYIIFISTEWKKKQRTLYKIDLESSCMCAKLGGGEEASIENDD